jgi:hypothetical protein
MARHIAPNVAFARELPSELGIADPQSGEHEIVRALERLCEEGGASDAFIELESVHPADEPTNTIRVTPEVNRSLLARAFDRDPDDEVTLELPVPNIPDHVPSPLGEDDDEQRPSEVEASAEDEPAPETKRSASPLAYALLADAAAARQDAQEPMKARAPQTRGAAAPAYRNDEARTKLVVVGIWTLVVLSGALLAFLTLSS